MNPEDIKLQNKLIEKHLGIKSEEWVDSAELSFILHAVSNYSPLQNLRALLEDYAEDKNREQIELLKQQIEDMKSNKNILF